MTINEFSASVSEGKRPDRLAPLLEAMWWEARGDWEKAHNLAQEVHDADGSLVHAYLHRAEGDQGNAAYWYRRAGRQFPDVSLPDEWRAIVEELLSRER